MSVRKAVAILPLASMLVTLLGAAAATRGDAIVADHFAVSKFAQIPSSVIEQITADLDFFYGHTSHGSQIMTGLSLLQAENALYTRPYLSSQVLSSTRRGGLSSVSGGISQVAMGKFIMSRPTFS